MTSRFVKLTTYPTGAVMFANVDQIATMHREAGGTLRGHKEEWTALAFADDGIAEVVETPEEILEKVLML